MNIKEKKEDELFLAIEHAIDDYIEFGSKELVITREDYEYGYNVKLKIEKRQLWVTKKKYKEALEKAKAYDEALKTAKKINQCRVGL